MKKELFALPEWIEAETWGDFEEMRRKIKKPLTDAARRLAIRRLEQIWNEMGHPPMAVLEQSILNSWQGLWPLSQNREDLRREESRREARAGEGPIGRVRPEYLRQIEALAKRKGM